MVRVLIKNCKASKESCKQQAPHHPSRKSAWHGSAEGKKEKDQVFFFAFPSAAQHEEARPKYVIVVDIPFFFFSPPFAQLLASAAVAIPHPEWKDFATQPNFVPAPLELTTEIRPLNLVPESALPASQLGVPPPGGFFSQYLGDQNSNTPLRTLSSPHQPNRHARALPTSAAVAPPAAPASAPPPLMNLPLLFSLPPAAAASLPPPPPPTDPVPRMNADAIDNARQFALAIRTLNREHQHSASPPMQQKCDLHEPPIEQLCASRGIDLFPITFTPSNAPRDPSVTPTIPPAGVCLFASLHTDLLRFILQNYFGLLDQLILRLVCKRWLETLRGTRMQLNLVDCGYFLSEHFRLPLLINTFPNARELRISFGPKPSSKMSRRYLFSGNPFGSFPDERL